MIFVVNINSLGITKERQIREIIPTPQGQIEVYEPTMDDISSIIDLQHGDEMMETGVVSFDGATVIKSLFPLLTNISFDGVSEDELQYTIDNPSVHLLITQQVVAQIVAEANKLYAMRVKTELMSAESTMAQMELMGAIPAFIVEKAKGDGNIAKLVEEVKKAEKELVEVVEREELAKRAENAETKISEDSIISTVE